MSEGKRPPAKAASVPFADAERFALEEDGQRIVWVVLAITEREGLQYALLAPEKDLGGGDGDMDVMICEYHRDEDGTRRLADVTDNAVYEAVYREMATNMGLEDAVDN
jgi:hypothetical protein